MILILLIVFSFQLRHTHTHCYIIVPPKSNQTRPHTHALLPPIHCLLFLYFFFFLFLFKLINSGFYKYLKKMILLFCYICFHTHPPSNITTLPIGAFSLPEKFLEKTKLLKDAHFLYFWIQKFCFVWKLRTVLLGKRNFFETRTRPPHTHNTGHFLKKKKKILFPHKKSLFTHRSPTNPLLFT